MKQNIIYPLGVATRDRIPPLGMCGADKPQSQFECLMPKVTIDGKGNNLSIENNLDEWNVPVIDITVRHKGVNIETRACINTGSYYSHVKEWIIDKLEVRQSYFARGSNPQYGIITTPTFNIDFSIKGIEANLNTPFMIMLPNFNYDIILGSHILDAFNLNIIGKDKKFVLELFA